MKAASGLRRLVPPPDRVPVRAVTTLLGTGWIEGVLTDTNIVAPVVGGSVGVPIVLEAEGRDVFGLVVKSEQRTILNLRMHTGMDLEEIGKPAVAWRSSSYSQTNSNGCTLIDELKKK